MAKFHIKTGDMVMVIAGREKGKSGRVVRMIPKQQRAVVEGINMITKHLKPSASNPQGGIESMEAPVHVSNLMVMDAAGTPTRTRIERNENGQAVRVSVKSGKPLTK
ncbi:MAG TPA: 50S ribosomal protein L24 [Cryomorphaceae bacterium]|nr:50S ribosomal protein L24 [Cryomorphaceae bacterium]